MEPDGGTPTGTGPRGRGRVCGQPVISRFDNDGRQYDSTADMRQPGGLPGRRNFKPEECRPAGNPVRPGGIASEPAARYQPGLVLSRHQQLPCDESLLDQAREPRTDVQDQLYLGKGTGPQFR